MNDVTARRLASLATNPDQLEEIEPGQVPELLGGLAELRARLELQLHRPGPSPPPATSGDDDRLLTVEEVAGRLGFRTADGEPDLRKVYRRADRWPFTRRLGDRTLRFSEAGLERWIRRQRI